jgi:hypothetical protein
LRSVVDPRNAAVHRERLIKWISALGADATPRSDLITRVA